MMFLAVTGCAVVVNDTISTGDSETSHELVPEITHDNTVQSQYPFYFFLQPNHVTTSQGEGVIYSFAVGRQPFNILDSSRWEDPLMVKINNELREAATSYAILAELVPVQEWLQEEFPTPILVTYNYRFISITTDLILGGPNRFTHFTHAVTINSETGERVFLDDLINICDVFIERLQTGNFIHSKDIMADSATATEISNRRIANMSREELRNFLEKASMSQYQVINERDENIPPIGALLNSNTFFVQPGRLVILEHTPLVPNQYIIYVEDILDFLKVPAW